MLLIGWLKQFRFIFFHLLVLPFLVGCPGGEESSSVDEDFHPSIASGVASVEWQGAFSNSLTSQNTYDFGYLSPLKRGTANFTLRNAGSRAATEMVVSGLEAPFSVSLTSCKNSLQENEKCSITVSFEPSSLGSFER